MNNKILVDAGENYEYIRTIIENKIELAKIDGAERVAKMLGSILLFTVLALFTVLLFVALLVSLTIWIISLTESVAIAMMITAGVIIFVGFLFYIFRKLLIYKPVTHFILDNILDID